MELTIANRLAFWSASSPEAPAIITPGRSPLTYGRLWQQTGAVVKALNAAGIGRHDRVAMVLPDGPEMVAAFLGIAAGATVAPLNPRYRADEFDFYLKDLKPKALFVQASSLKEVGPVAAAQGIPLIEIKPVAKAEAGVFTLAGLEGLPKTDGNFAQPGDVALLLHTSGTTSRPKLVPLTQANLCISADNIVTTLRLTQKDLCLNVMPLFHIHGIVGAVLSSLLAGAGVICDGEFRAENFFTLLRDYRPTWYTAVPTIHQAILSYIDSTGTRLEDSSLRFIRSSSAALPPPVMKRLEELFGVPVIESYGMTEAAHQMASNPLPPQARKPGSVGLAAGPEVAVMGEKGEILASGTVGEVVILGGNVMAGYGDNPEAKGQCFTHGWFRTGDQGYFDQDGYLFLTGRLKEIINRGGEKIAPKQVDEILLAHPAVAQAVTFAVSHDTLGEDVAAAVVLAPGKTATAAEIQRFVAIHLADFKVPQQIVILEEIPKGPTGKIQRIGLAEKLAARLQSPFAEPRTPVEKTLTTLWSDVLAVKQIGIHDNFFALGGDSLSAARLFARIASAYDRKLPLATLFEAPTIELLAKLLEDNERSLTTSCLVAIQPEGSRTPFFCIHNPGGQVINYRQLAYHLGADQPFYGLQAQALGGNGQIHKTVEEMALHYIKEIQSVQPRGPYFLGGFCLGGQIAYEMARRLRAHGEEVGLLALFESFVRRYPASMGRKVSPRVKLARVAQKAFFHARTISKIPSNERAAYLVRRAVNAKILLQLRLARALDRTCKIIGLSVPSTLQLRDLTLVHYQAGRTYVPEPYAGETALFLAQETPEVSTDDPRLGWRRLVSGGLEVHELACSHDDMLREPNVRLLAEKLGACIAKKSWENRREE